MDLNFIKIVPRISMIEFSVMCFIEDQEANVAHMHESLSQTLEKDICRTDYNHVFCKQAIPHLLRPK